MKMKALSIVVTAMIGIIVSGCLTSPYQTYDSGKIKFEYPNNYEVTINNTEDSQTSQETADLFTAGVAVNDINNPDHESVAVTKYNNMTLYEATNLNTENNAAEDNTLGGLENGGSGLDTLWMGQIQGRPAALLSNVRSIPDLQLWELDIQDGGSTYTILFWTRSVDWENVTLGGGALEVPKNFAHIIKTLSFH